MAAGTEKVLGESAHSEVSSAVAEMRGKLAEEI